MDYVEEVGTRSKVLLLISGLCLGRRTLNFAKELRLSGSNEGDSSSGFFSCFD